ncbi:glycosyltransferase [Thermochromatium tepidum]|nr:glycosyltransferase [Thermochromatium tepidum]
MDDSLLPPQPSAQGLEILIPVFNGYESVRRCLDSVLAHSPADCAIRILDDASTDLRLLDWLDELESREPRVSVNRADENLGFVGNVNRGLATACGDVILLNSDTVVTAGWVERLLACAASDPRIALVCPLSNNATILSVPRMNGDNPIPDGLTIDRFGALVESVSARRYPRLPVAVGFCMLIRWEAIQRLGLLHRAYHRGYGEECDYSLRAWEAGFEVACCDDVFVYHEGEQSFGTIAGMEWIKRRNESVLLARWPFYHRLIRRFCQLNPLREVQERILTGLAHARGDRAPHILSLLHSYHALGGTELHSRALVEGLAETYRVTVLFPDETDPYLDYGCVADHEWFRVLAYQRALIQGTPRLFGQVASLRNAVVESSFARLLAGGSVALVHVQHLLHWGTLELPLIARRLGAVVVLSLHDYFLFCPVFDMLRPDGTPCDKARAEATDPECLDCLIQHSSAEETPDRLRLYLHARHAKLCEVFAASTAIVSPSRFVLERFRRAYGDALAAKVRVIPHGIPDLGRAPKPSLSPVFRLGVFANLSRRKGAEKLLETIGLLRARRCCLEILHFGGVDPDYLGPLDAAGVRRQGVYRHQDLARLTAEVDLALVPSVYEETFCLTIAELQALGVPVLAFGVGAIPERIQDGVTGFLVMEASARALAERIERLIADPEPLRQVRARLRAHSVKSLASNVLDYAELYAELLDGYAAQPSSDLSEILADLDSAPGSDNLVAMSSALLKAFTPDWGRLQAGYGEPNYRRWLESQGVYRSPCYGREAEERFELLMVIFEFEREPGALAATLDSLLTPSNLRRGLQCLVVSRFDPLPVQRPACQWLRVAHHQSVARLVNRRLAEWRGDWIGLMVAGDRLHPAALGLLRGHITQSPRWRLIYTDEDRIAEDGRRYHPIFKPDFDLDLLRCQDYLGDLCLIARDAVLDCGGLLPQIEVARLDLCLKVADRFGESAIGHIPHVLYHRADSRSVSPPAFEAIAKVLTAHLERRRTRAQVRATSVPWIHWIDHPVLPKARTTLLVLTQGDVQAVTELIDSIRPQLGRLEILVLDFQRKGALPKPSQALIEVGAVRWQRAASGENIAHSLNRAIRSLKTDRVLVVHDGLRARPGSALTILFGLIDRPEVALVGPCILDPEGRILQGYPLLGFWPLGVMGQLHRGQGLGDTADGSLNRHLCVQRCATVSDQAFALWLPAFKQAGGFDATAFPNAWYLLDLGLRLADLGYQTLWTPHATLVAEPGRGRFQGYRRRKLKGSEVAEEVARLYQRWLPRLARDPAYNPNLSLRDPSAQPETEIEQAWDPVLCEVPRLLGFPGDHGGSGHYRVIDPLTSLRTQGLACCALVPSDRPIRPPSVVELERLAPDTLLLHNALHDRHLHALELYRRYTQARLVFSLDDLITKLPPWNPFRDTNYPDLERRLDQALGLCDRLVVSTPLLAEFYGGRHGDIRVVPNRLPRARWQGLIDGQARAKHSGRKPRVGWAGAAQHAADLEWLAPVVAALADEVEWCFLGLCPDALRPYARIVQPMVEFVRYPSALAGLKLDVAIAPLALHDFNRCKSAIKLLEYGALGIPVICTDIEPYREAPVERLPNHPPLWIEALRARLADLESAHREGRALQRWVESGWMLDDALPAWIEALSPSPS